MLDRGELHLRWPNAPAPRGPNPRPPLGVATTHKATIRPSTRQTPPFPDHRNGITTNNDSHFVPLGQNLHTAPRTEPTEITVIHHEHHHRSRRTHPGPRSPARSPSRRPRPGSGWTGGTKSSIGPYRGHHIPAGKGTFSRSRDTPGGRSCQAPRLPPLSGCGIAIRGYGISFSLSHLRSEVKGRARARRAAG